MQSFLGQITPFVKLERPPPLVNHKYGFCNRDPVLFFPENLYHVFVLGRSSDYAEINAEVPHSSRDQGSILSSGAICVESAQSPSDHMGLLWMLQMHIPKTCRLVD